MMYCTQHRRRHEDGCPRCDLLKEHDTWVAAKKLENLSVSGIEAEVCADIALRQAKGISKFRQISKAFVVTNGVKVEGVAGADELAASVEDIRSVDVLQMLIDTLDPDQAACVRKLLAGEM